MEYIRYILFAAPWMTSSMVQNNQLRFQGSAVYAMVGMVAGAVLNIFLDPIFIFVFHMGVRGAAIATMISQFVSCIILMIGGSIKGNIRIGLKNFAPGVKLYLEIIRGGLPALLRQGLMSVSSIVINHFAGTYGDAAIAAISIVNRIFMFANSTILGFGQGFQPVCGFNYGAKRYDRVKKAFWFCVRLCTTGLMVVAIVLAIFTPQVIGIFRKDDPEVLRIGILSLRLRCLALPFNAWIIICNMLTQTIGKSFQASLLAISRQGLFLLPALLVFTPFLGLLGIQISPPVAEFISFFFAIPLISGVLREMKEKPLENGNYAEPGA
jgi:putative MATE family efflux protein